MNLSKQNFRVLLVLGWIMFFLAIAAHLYARNYLPAELREVYDTYRHSPENSPSQFGALLVLAYLIFCVAVSIGLFFFKKWARDLFFISIIFGSFLFVSNRVYLEVSWVNLLKDFMGVINGLIVGIIYFSPLKDEFKSKKTL
jgi:hypothetical protein